MWDLFLSKSNCVIVSDNTLSISFLWLSDSSNFFCNSSTRLLNISISDKCFCSNSLVVSCSCCNWSYLSSNYIKYITLNFHYECTSCCFMSNSFLSKITSARFFSIWDIFSSMPSFSDLESSSCRCKS